MKHRRKIDARDIALAKERPAVDRGYLYQSAYDWRLTMRNVAALVAILLMGGAPAVLAQTTSPSPPAASSSTTAGSGTTTAAGKMSDQEVKKKLESEGYTQVRDVTSTPEGMTARAMKGDKAVTLVIDSSGHVKENKIGP